MNQPMTDTLAPIATGVSLGSALVSTIAPHPVQIIAWVIAIVGGLLACISWGIKIQHQIYTNKNFHERNAKELERYERRRKGRDHFKP